MPVQLQLHLRGPQSSAHCVYLEWFNDKNSGEEGDEEGGEPLVGLVVSEHDPEGEEKEDGDQDRQDAKGPANKDAIPIDIWFILSFESRSVSGLVCCILSRA